ncbi:FAD-dependent monooxygenase [Oceanibium sediminis]|uniref:FAD-dependent monooxygenase n=1 Tax=Oceanibium sediminis TaxID=2026339 RepID=UPI000DD39067|nr:FAD-dependent monooxygenase [Oceanibium sediminis]
MSTDTDILIVGGGLAGPALALALARNGLSCHVLDAAPAETLGDPDFDGRAYALALSTRRMLDQLGLWSGVADKAEAIRDIRVSDGQAGQGASPLFLHFDHNEITEGPMGHMLEDRFLRRALATAVADHPAITLKHSARVVAQDSTPGNVSVTLEDGTKHHARLLIGADGRASGTAARAGISRTGWDYGQTSLVGALTVEKPHNGVAQQMFFPEGPLAVLPLTGQRVSIVWTESRDRARDIMAMDDEGYLAALRPRFGSYLGNIALAGKRYSYPLGLSLASAITAPRLALVGDAAHGIHPLAGQGLNLGLRDVAALAEVLVTAHRRGEDIGAADVLERYRRWRGFDIAMLATATDGINRIFSNDNPLLRLGRTLGLGAVNALPGARRRLIREAAGLTGDLPRLLQGQPI